MALYKSLCVRLHRFLDCNKRSCLLPQSGLSQRVHTHCDLTSCANPRVFNSTSAFGRYYRTLYIQFALLQHLRAPPMREADLAVGMQGLPICGNFNAAATNLNLNGNRRHHYMLDEGPIAPTICILGFHTPVTTVAINKQLSLPNVVLRRLPQSHDYACGLWPSNCPRSRSGIKQPRPTVIAR